MQALDTGTWDVNDERWFLPASALMRDTFAGFPIGADTALRVSAVFACNSLIAETLASLPCVLYRRLPDGGKEKAKKHRLYRTLRYQPNRRMSPMDYFGGQQMHLGLRGNAIAEIRDDGQTIELFPVHPDRVRIDLLDSGRVRYEVQDVGGGSRVLSQDRVLHVKDLSMDGIGGLSRTSLAREAIAVAAAGEAFVGAFFRNDATGRLLITHPAALSEEKRKEFRQMIQENYAGWANRAKAMLLTNGVTATELGKHDDSGFIIDPRRFQVADIARFWRVPLFMIGLEEKSTTWGTGIEQQKQGFVDFTIKSWADRHAQAMQLALLSEEEQDEYFIEYLFVDLVRGDLKTRMEAYQIGRQIGMYSPNRLLEKENENPRDDPAGDEYQDTPTGAAPNAPRTAPAAKPPPEPAAKRLPAPLRADVLVADAARRIAGAERGAVERRCTKQAATPDASFAQWGQEHFAGDRERVLQILTPLAAALDLPVSVAEETAQRIERTAVLAWLAGLPEGWAAQREAEVQMLVAETFQVGQRLTRSDATLLAVVTEQGRQVAQLAGALQTFLARPDPPAALPPVPKRIVRTIERGETQQITRIIEQEEVVS